MKIRLTEIPEEGRKFVFSRESGELNNVLEDLLPGLPYKVELTLRRLGNAYEMEGRVVSALNEVCSLCGWDLNLPLDKTFREVLVEEENTDRETHHVHGNQALNLQNDQTSSTYRDDLFDVGEFIHEFIAISEPTYPTCGDRECEHLEEVQAKRRELDEEFHRADETLDKNPFAKLSNLKLN